MKRNINLMQQNADLNSSSKSSTLTGDVFNNEQKEYILQALANLGQRMGIKGDGLGYRSFNFLDLLNNDALSYSPEKYIGYLEYKRDEEDDQNVAIFGLYDIKKNVDIILESIVTKSVNDILYLDKEFSFSIPVNGIEKYAKGTIISNKNNILTIITVGKFIGYDDDDPFNSELMYYKFDIIDNKIIYAAKLFHIFEDNKSNYFVLERLFEDSSKNNSKYSNSYNLNIQIFNSNVLNEIYKTPFNELFCFDNYHEDNELPFNLLRSDFLDVDILEGKDIYNNSSSFNFDSNSPISIILNNEANTNFYTETNLKLSFDTIQNEYVNLTDNFEEIISLYKNEYKFTNLEETIYEFNSDMTELYKNIFLLYNDKFYIENRTQLFKRIICKLYEELIEDDNLGRLYVPLNYDINYICNSNDELNIYYSTDIYVLLTNINEKGDKAKYLSNSKYIIYDYNNIDKVKSYKFEVEYNKYYEDLINNVYIRPIYVMPYVNDSENWNINGENTNIRAVGRDAGNPNIIIIYSKNKDNLLDSYYVINAIKDKETIVKSGFVRKKIKIDPKLFTGLQNQIIYCYAYVPIIDNDNKQAFENSLIINICDLNCLDNETYIDSYIGSNIITFWYYDYKEKEYQFSLVTEDGSDYALPLGATTNIASILSRNKLAGISTNDILILNAKISKLAHESLGINSLHYEILRNKTATEYNTYEIDQSFDYFNNLNAIIEYTDNLLIDGNNITYEQTEKYLPDVKELETTNILYPKYEIVSHIITDEVERVILKLEEVVENEEIITINVNNEGDIVWSNEIREKLNTRLVPSTETNKVTVIYKTVNNEVTSNYEEYIFNSNVPTLDLKEIFVRNMNNLNRLNIISLDNEGNSYYAYIGTSYDESNKGTLHLSSIEKNINIGSNTLINEINRENFRIHNKISIDFNNIYMNPKYDDESHSYGLWSSWQSPIVEFAKENNNYGMGTIWLSDILYDQYRFNSIPRADRNLFFEHTVVKQQTNNPLKFTDLINDTRVGAIKLGEMDGFTTSDEDIENIIHLPGFKKCNHNDNSDFMRFGVSINTIMLKLFNINLTDYVDTGVIRIFHGKNKMMVYGDFEEENKYRFKEYLPYFFLLLNDENATDHNGVLNTSETVDISYEKYISKYNNEDIERNFIDIYIEFGKHNIPGFGFVECKDKTIYISGESEESGGEDTTIVFPYYWYCGLVNLTPEAIEIINNNNSEEQLHIIHDDQDTSQGWRRLCNELPPDTDIDVTIWRADDMFNIVEFPINWENSSENGASYYLIIPIELRVRDSMYYDIEYDVINPEVTILGHKYKIWQSKYPWYEFAYSIYKP